MQKSKKMHKKSAFLLKTYDILNNETFKSILDWNEDGVGFIIYDIEKFAGIVLPNYFKHSNFPSYIRQLNMYGFSKKRTTKNESYYFHPKFCKNQKQLIGEIQRRVEKKFSKTNEETMRVKSPSKIPSEISIELESKPAHVESQEKIEGKLCMDFYKLMNSNQALLHLQVSAIVGILSDMKSMTCQSYNEEQENIKNTFLEYLKIQNQFQNSLFSKAKSQIKNSEKYIKSSILLETKETLHLLGENGESYKC